MAQKAIIIPGEKQQNNIVIQTRKGNPVQNVQEYELTPNYLELVKELNKRYAEPIATFVNEASPIYNCHGFTFGSRRSAIWDPKDVRKILDEDNYKKVNDNDIRVGDIIIYSGHKGNIEHSGLVIGKEEEFPLILSKWGYGREVVHLFNQCPYFPEYPIVEYFRISDE